MKTLVASLFVFSSFFAIPAMSCDCAAEKCAATAKTPEETASCELKRSEACTCKGGKAEKSCSCKLKKKEEKKG